MTKKLSSILFFTVLLFCVNFAVADKNITTNQDLKSDIETLNENISENIWMITYENFNNYQALNRKKDDLEYKIRKLENKKSLSVEQKNRLQALKDELIGINNKLILLSEYDNEPFEKLLSLNKIDPQPEITNPLDIFYALSYQEKLKINRKEFNDRYNLLSDLINNLEEKKTILEELIKISKNDKEQYYQELEKTAKIIKIFKPIKENAKATKSVYDKKIDEIKSKLAHEITNESKKFFTAIAIIGIFFALLLLSKHIARKYLVEAEKLYKINKTLNITFFTFSILLLIFIYMENITYLVTILGFASAGLAIALKDLFMSIIGWFVIFFGNNIHVGDRIRFVKDGSEYVGDIIDISLLKITILEDVTLTTFERNRRAGRVVYVPNNYVFTNMIANYTHDGLDTVWDGIDYVVTFDSNINKASKISKDIAIKYSKTFSDNTKKNLNKLRRRYHLQNIKVEPRVFTLITPYGMKISVWYLTNSYATLHLRSIISTFIINAIKKERDIHLAYPTQAINMSKDRQKYLYDTPEENTI